MNKLIALCGASLLFATGSAVAAAAQTKQPTVLDAVVACRMKTGEAERLACYDAAAAQVETAVRTGSVTVVDRAEVRRVRRSLFGFSIPDIPFFGRDGEEELKEFTATVRSASADPYNKWTVALEDGAVWRTTEPLRGFREPRKGATVRLRKGTLGGYWLSVGGDLDVRAIRLR